MLFELNIHVAVKYAINLTYVGYYYRPLTGIVNYLVKRSTNDFYPKSDKTYWTYYYNTAKYIDIYRVYRLYKNADISMEYAFMSNNQYLDIHIRASL